MNVEKILQLADHVEKLPHDTEGALGTDGFCMAVFGEDSVPPEKRDDYDNGRLDHCGTVACLAGWTVALFTGEDVRTMDGSEVHRIAADILELSEDSSNRLFTPNITDNLQLHPITPQSAAKVLRELAAQRGVEWRRVLPADEVVDRFVTTPFSFSSEYNG